jgi:hypothetical protein
VTVTVGALNLDRLASKERTHAEALLESESHGDKDPSQTTKVRKWRDRRWTV